VTIAEGLNRRGRSSTAPTDEGNYDNRIKNMLAFLILKRYVESSSLQDLPYLSDNTSEYVKMSSRDRPRPAVALTTLASVVIILGAIVAQIMNPKSVVFPLIAAFGLSVLATVVLAHQRHR
jgi:hypothetical protein